MFVVKEIVISHNVMNIWIGQCTFWKNCKEKATAV